MHKIPENLKKYFFSPRGQEAQKVSTTKQINSYLLDAMKLETRSDIFSLRVSNSKNPFFFKLTQKDCNLAFMASCWDNLSIDERISTIYTLIKSLTSTEFKSTPRPQLHLVRAPEQSNISGIGYFKQGITSNDNIIYIDSEKIMKHNGLTIANIVAHELQHTHDY